MNKKKITGDGKKKILIVEDTMSIAKVLSGLLEKYGAIDVAYDGQEALSKVALEHYDAIISDVKMPVMDGIEFYKAAVENDSNIKNRFLFYTSTISKDHLNFFIDNDVPFLFKPADFADTEDALNEILDTSYPCSSEDTDVKNTDVGV